MPVTESYLAILDTETTGVEEDAEVIELACILTDMKLVEIGRFHGKFKPTKSVAPAAAAVNGYDAEVWEREAVAFADYVRWLGAKIPFGHVAVPVSHNLAFDLPKVLRAHKAANGGRFCPISYRGICTLSVALTLRLSGAIRCENVKLATVATAMDLPAPEHRAMADAETARALLGRAVELLGPRAIVAVEA